MLFQSTQSRVLGISGCFAATKAGEQPGLTTCIQRERESGSHLCSKSSGLPWLADDLLRWESECRAPGLSRAGMSWPRNPLRVSQCLKFKTKAGALATGCLHTRSPFTLPPTLARLETGNAVVKNLCWFHPGCRRLAPNQLVSLLSLPLLFQQPLVSQVHTVMWESQWISPLPAHHQRLSGVWSKRR